MSPAVEHPPVRYLSRRCPFFQRDVWAIVTRQPDRRWKIVNCLDKDNACCAQPCALTVDGGTWPFGDVWVPDPPLSGGRLQESEHA